MKYYFFLFFLSFTPVGNAANLQDVRQCLNSIPSPIDADYEEAVRTCFNRAKAFAELSSVSGRALYLRALSFQRNLDWNGQSSFFLAISDELLDYYRTHLIEFLRAEHLSRLPNQALLDSFTSIDQALFYPSIVYPDPTGLDEEFQIFTVLEKRNLATTKLAEMIYYTLLRNSRWTKAQEISERWPKLSALPKVILNQDLSSSDLAYFNLSLDLNTLTLETLSQKKGPSILIFGDCHFAIDAYRELSARADFVRIMFRYGLVMGSPDNLDFVTIDSARKQFPAFEIHPLYKTGAWFQRGFNNFVSPNFAFLIDGKIVHEFQSKTTDLQKEFCVGLSKISIVNSEYCN